MFSTKLKELIGFRPASNEKTDLEKPMRFHQSWWRAFVLAETEGQHPGNRNQVIGNTIYNGIESKKNFLNENIKLSVDETLIERKKYAPGIMRKDRLFNNLLSSQPLCFNFFGEFKQDKIFALNVLKCFYPKINKVYRVLFEYKPIENYTNDNSAFDVFFEVGESHKKGFIGFECKFVDELKSDKHDKTEYRTTYEESNIFLKSYDTYLSKDYNQLFRNQLIAESVLQNNNNDFAYTGLFCHHKDEYGIETATKFRDMLKPRANLQIITYKDFIENLQRQDITWEQREWTMLLWARYCSTKLSDNCKKLVI